MNACGDGLSGSIERVCDVLHLDHEPPRLYDTPGEVPPVPSLEELAACMDEHPIGAGDKIVTIVVAISGAPLSGTGEEPAH